MGLLGSWGFNTVSVGTFVASAVEVTEMVVIVVGVGAVRGWRSTTVGAASGFVVLAGIVIALGQALSLIPIGILRVVIGALLLTFGLQWYRKGVVRVADRGFTGGEGEEVDVSSDSAGGVLDWTAFVLSFKGVLLEGLEIAFIVVAFGAGSRGTGAGGYPSAYAGALAALVVIGGIGLIAKGWLEKVPGQTLKFAVGGLLTTFGTFWMAEGIGVEWPTGQWSLAWLYLVYLASTFGLMWLARSGALGPPPGSVEPSPGQVDPAGVAPASAASVRDFQRRHDLADDGVIGPRTQAAIRTARLHADGQSEGSQLVVDAADPASILAVQARLGLPETRMIDAITRGALRVLQHPGVLDPEREGAVLAFQRSHDLQATAELDAGTLAGAAAIRADRSTPDGGSGADPLRSLRELDLADCHSVTHFQTSVGLAPDGRLGDETRGALQALVTLSGAAPTRPAGPTTEPDVLDRQSVERFQRVHGLPPTGTVDEATRQAIRWERDHFLGVDAASREHVLAFQREHGLTPDGEVGPVTQSAMRAERAEREATDDRAARERYGPTDGRHHFRLFDPADPEQVREFQRHHSLAATGVVDEVTQAAMRAVRSQRPPVQSPDEPGTTAMGTLGRWIAGFGRFWYGFIIGDDWVTAFGVVVALAGTYGLAALHVTAWWLAPVLVIATAASTVHRSLARQSAGPC
jgi:uncharacterized membrane protein